MSDQAPEGTGAALQEFLAWAGRTGEMNPTTAEAWAVACRRVLEVEGDPDNVDVRSIDIDALTLRFENLNRTKFTSGSMKTYKSRFASAVNAYLAWLNNEPWKPSSRTSKKAAAERASVHSIPGTGMPKTGPQKAHLTELPAHGSSPLLVPYTMPLRPDLMVELTLPADLTARDADRIAAFVRSLAFTAEPAKEPG